MKIKAITGLSITTLATGLVSVHAQNLNGTVNNAFYGAPLAVQTINSGFGYAGGVDSGGGSELDAGYGKISGGNLYVFLAGNVENNGNHLNVFIAGGAAGQNTLNAPAGSNLASMNGSVFSPGFNATFGFDVNDFSGTQYGEEDYLTGTPTGSYVGSIAGSPTGIYAGTFSGGVTSLYANNNHVSTMSGTVGAAYSGGASVTTGYELVIPLSAIGYTGGSIMVLADINGAGSPPNTYLSNQFLPGLPVGSQNVGGGTTPFSTGGGTFNFGNTPGEYFTVPAPVPEPTTLALVGLSGLATLVAARRRK